MSQTTVGESLLEQQSLFQPPFTIKSRVLVSRGSRPGATSPTHLEEVRDYLEKLTEKQDPIDHDRSLDQLHINFNDSHMSGRFLARNGLSDEHLLVSETGASQLAKQILPSRFFSGLKDLARLDVSGEKLATMVWDKFAGTKEKVRMIRTINMRVGEETRRVIRSCHSQEYAAYSNLEFVQDMLDHAEDYSELPVLDWRVTDTGMRLRFAAIDAPTAVLRHWDPSALLDQPIPMIEAWNSEVGCRRVGLRGGMWRLVCTNGMGHWDDNREWKWIHRGKASRIQDGVRSAFEDLFTTANGVVDAYKTALDVSIDDAYLWMERELTKGGRATKKQITASQAGLTHPTTSAGGTLGSVVDAITLAAQSEPDIFSQYELERTASYVMQRGLAAALHSNGAIGMGHWDDNSEVGV